MKTLIFFISILSIAPICFAAPVIGGRAPIKKMEINCSFLDDENKFLTAAAYSLPKGGEVSFAKVKVYRQIGSQQSILDRFRLDFIQPVGLSFFYEFADKQKKIHFEAFADDMGGMSSLTLNGEVFDLTCSVEI